MTQRRGRHPATLARRARVVERDRPARARLRRLGLAGLAFGFALAAGVILPVAAHAEPAFGDSDWVAPLRSGDPADPSDPGPRVAPPDHEPLGVSLLRLPFRVAFYPLRLLARGGEWAIGRPGLNGTPPSVRGPRHRWKLGPIGTTDPGVGLRVTRMLDPRGDAKLFATGVIAWDEGRKAKLVYRSDKDDAPRAFHFEGQYTFRPDKTFYGIGNASALADKSIWLGEEARATALFHLGSPVRKELRVYGTYSAISAREGKNGPAGIPSVENRFTADEVPFLTRASRVASLGVAADVGALDQAAAPRRGVAARLSAEQFKATDTSDLDYRRYRTEARAYLPVFADRRVLAFRLLHDWVAPAAGSPAVPYYRLPESNDDLRFPGYNAHRFTDKHLVLAQLEYRWQVLGDLFALLEASAGEVASTAGRLRYDQRHEAYGLGFRYGYSDRFSARFDAAKGSEGWDMALTLEGPF